MSESGRTHLDLQMWKFQKKKKNRQSVQICCREKQKKVNNGNSKAFCVRRKYNKLDVLRYESFASSFYLQNLF